MNDIHRLVKGEHTIFLVGKPKNVVEFLKDIWEGKAQKWQYEKKKAE